MRRLPFAPRSTPTAARTSASGPGARPGRSGRGRRLLVASAAAVAVSLAAGACDTAPVAASVNGSEIKQTALNLELRLQTSNRAYVASIDRAAASGSGSISVTGDSPGTYSTKFVAGVLSTMIQALAVHQHLVARGQLPGAAQLAAARSVDEALFGSTWLSFPQAFRDTQVAQDAEHAAIEPAPTNASSLLSAYKSVQRFFFASVCVRVVAVSVDDAGGSLDMARSLAQATSLVSRYNSGDQSIGGVVTCYTGFGLERQGAALFNQVLGLAPGTAAAPQRTSFGYQVVAVDSRTEQPFDTVVQKALALGIAQAQGASDPALGAVVGAARVSVDPQYGTWDRQTGSITVPSPLGANSSTTP